MSTEKKFTKTQVPEIWGGIECSYNRVRSRYFDQLKFARHYSRIESDIASFADVGISTMRYPVIWERLQPRKESSIDWRSVEFSLEALHHVNIKPIVGLVHHGSGPKFAPLHTPAFAEGLKNFASVVAEKFPWIDYYTPVNEPLTTARFCGLYGLWYPHKRNDRTFVNCLLNELKGIVLAMQEIKKINPHAKLVQTEDLAKIYSTPLLQYQAEFENHRRWLTYDILCGKLTSSHPLWKYFLHYTDNRKDLDFFVDNPFPPDIIGLDYYPTSERYLDEKLELYPANKHGHNRKHHYADVEAIRVRLNQPWGIRVLLQEVWDRYHIPMAVTECHIHCDYENQIRWFGQVREACIQLINKGVDIKAVTTWAMLGAFGWNRLLTSEGGDYESGAFDISSGVPSLTPVGDYIKTLIKDPGYVHPALSTSGWWQLESRFLFENNLANIPEVMFVSDCAER